MHKGRVHVPEYGIGPRVLSSQRPKKRGIGAAWADLVLATLHMLRSCFGRNSVNLVLDTRESRIVLIGG